MDKKIIADEFIKQLCDELGLDNTKVRRIVIDAEVRCVVKVYVDLFGNQRLMKVGIPDTNVRVEILEEK